MFCQGANSVNGSGPGRCRSLLWSGEGAVRVVRGTARCKGGGARMDDVCRTDSPPRSSLATAGTRTRPATRPSLNQCPDRATLRVCSSADLGAAMSVSSSYEVVACLVIRFRGRGQSLPETEGIGWACSTPEAPPGENHQHAAKPTTAWRSAFTTIGCSCAIRKSRRGRCCRLRSRSGRRSFRESSSGNLVSNGSGSAPHSRRSESDTEVEA